MNKDTQAIDMENWYNDRMFALQTCKEEVTSLLDRILRMKSIPYQNISGRVKSLDSFIQKSNKDKYSNPYDEITDLVGFRIITYTNREVEQICEIIKKEFDVDPLNSMNKADDMGNDKVGYLSVHFVCGIGSSRKELVEYQDIKDLKFEIQVRTILQHAWAEIEHDRSYKFSGELRNDLKRRFYLLAGVLELVDLEFEKLSQEIDEYALNVFNDTKAGKYESEIDSTSLTEYMKVKYGEKSIDCLGNVIDNEIIQELKDYGLERISDLEAISKDEYVNRDTTYIGILRDIMIINDPKQYFNNAFKDRWGIGKLSDIKHFKQFGINILDYIILDDEELALLSRYDDEE